MGSRPRGGLQRPEHRAFRGSAQEVPSSAPPSAADVGEPRTAELNNKLFVPLQNSSLGLIRVPCAYVPQY